VGLLVRQLSLNCIEELPIQDGWLLSGQDLAFVCDLTYEETTAEEVRERPPTERYARPVFCPSS
jgi:hypothetical protein